MFVNLITQTEQSRTNNRAYAPVPPPRCGMPVSDNILKESTKLPFYDGWAYPSMMGGPAGVDRSPGSCTRPA